MKFFPITVPRRLCDDCLHSKSPVLNSQDAFLTHIKEVFGTSASALSVHEELLNLWLVEHTTCEYTLRFRTLTASGGWNEAALLLAYQRGLRPAIRWQMALTDNSIGLETFMLKAQHVSQHLTKFAVEERSSPNTSPCDDSPAPEAMQADENHLCMDQWSDHCFQSCLQAILGSTSI